jgi:hypothetical protein
MDKLLPNQNFSLEDMDGEIWKDIQGYDGYYQVSNCGRIKSLSRDVFNGIGYYLKKEKILKPTMRKDGYQVVGLYIENISKNFLVHKLVATAFVKNLFNKEKVIHIDFIKHNNKSNNLEWTNLLETACYQMSNQKSSSNFIGVSFRKNRNKWLSTIVINGKLIYIGSFKNQEEAYQARCDYEKNNNIENKYL